MELNGGRVSIPYPHFSMSPSDGEIPLFVNPTLSFNVSPLAGEVPPLANLEEALDQVLPS